MNIDDLHLDRVKNIPTSGWIAVAIAAAAGAIATHSLFKTAFGGALLGAGAAFAYELVTAPCCAGCAQGAGCGGAATATATAPALGMPEKTISGAPAYAATTGTMPMSPDYPDTGPGTVDFDRLWSGAPASSSSSSGGCS